METTSGDAPFFMIFVMLLIQLPFIILLLISYWKICVKAGRPGWQGIIPIYNYFVFAEIGKNPSWWGAMMFVPIANIVFMIKILHGISKSFGKDESFTVGLVLLGIVFLPILAFGPAKYIYNNENESSEELLDS